MEHFAVAYHGGGFIGLSGAAYFARNGVPVQIVDPSLSVCEAIQAGTCDHVPGLEEFLGFSIYEYVQSGYLSCSANSEAADAYNIHIIAVPTEKNGEPHMTIVRQVVDELAEEQDVDRTDALTVIIESTLEPGEAGHLLMRFEREGWEAGRNLRFIVAPRRDWFVSPEQNLELCSRVIGGATEQCLEMGLSILQEVSKEIHCASNHEVAGMVKSMENALLFVPVAFCEEVALAYPRIDMNELLKLCGTHWRLPEYHIGPGMAGYCVPLGAKYIRAGATQQQHILSDAINMDQELWRYEIANVLVGHTSKRDSVGILGISYKADLKVHQLSPAFRIAMALRQAGREPVVIDPMYRASEIDGIFFDQSIEVDARTAKELAEEKGENLAALVILTDHKSIKDVKQWTWMMEPGLFILDTVGAWEGHEALFKSKEVNYRRLGTPGWNELPRR